jgi:UDP-N-acetyl-2-amino-2-deoxyglucuronate dehydrogenase
MKKDKIKIAHVGCGRISKNHFEAVKNLKKECEIVAVCDIVPERAEAAGKENGVPFFTDYDKMLAEVECDLVVIATPSGLHPEMGVKAAEAGINVLTEKPMAISLEGADSLIDACDKNGVQLFVVKQNRLNTTMQLLKHAIDKGRFGKIYTAYVNVFWQRPQNYYDMAPWRGTWSLDGGAYMNQASHYIDLLYWLMGDVSEVTAMTDTLARNIEAEDAGSAVFRFANGALGGVNVTMLTYPKNIEGSVAILGEKGTVKIGGMALNKVEHWEFSDYHDDDKFIEQSNYTPPNVYGFGHHAYYSNVFAAMRGEKAPDTDGRTGRKSLEIILAIYKSAKEKRFISLPMA